MAAKLPELSASEASPELPRFPLAARALRTSPVPGAAVTSVAPVALPQQARAPSNWPLYLFLFLLPLQNIQVGYLPNLGTGLNFLNVMFLLSLVGAWMTRGQLARDEPVNRWVLAYAIYAVISLLIGTQYVSDTGTHINTLKDHLLGLFVVYLVQMSVSDWSGVRRIVLATVLPLPYIAKVVWVQHASVAGWHYSDDLRIPGTFTLLGANEFAAFCVTVTVMLSALLLAARASKFWRLMLLGGIACMMLGVLYTYSRTAYISLILGLLAVILVWRGRWKMLLPLLLAAALIPSVLPYSVTERFGSTTVEENKRDESTDHRIAFWRIAWDNFLRHPVTGTGFHSFHHREINPYHKDTHNLYLRSLTEGGVVGAGLLLGLLLAVLRVARRELAQAHTGSWRYALALGLIGAWMALICGNLFGDRFTYYPMIAYFWVYVALVLKARHLPAEKMA